MSFGDFVDNSCGGGEIVAAEAVELAYNNMPSGVVSQPRPVAAHSLLLPNNNKSSLIFNSPALSLALQTSAVAKVGGGGMVPETFNQAAAAAAAVSTTTGSGRRSREEQEQDLNNTSRSGGSDNFLNGTASGDDLDASDDNPPARKKRYHRHTPQQIQELEALFKECPHPDEKQRLELSRRLCLKTRQVKFWFQNRRTQMKTQIERHENSILRQENDKLKAENMSIRDAMRNPICTNCGGPAILGDIFLEEQHVRIENARLKDELDRVCTLAGKFLGSPISSLTSTAARSMSMSMPMPMPPTSTLELGVGLNGFDGLTTATTTMAATLPLGPDHFGGSGICPTITTTRHTALNGTTGGGGIEGYCYERSMLLELALAAMEELIKMAQGKELLWVRTSSLEDHHGGGREVLNREEYTRSAFTTACDIGGLKFGAAATTAFATEASRETGVVIINSLALVETLMDSNRWAEMFPCMIGRTTTTDVISSGMGGTRNGALQLMRAELQVLSPLVPVREVSFLRFCKQHAEGVWAVVDVSVDTMQLETSGVGGGGAPTYLYCKRLPSGCVVQDMPNGYSKVTWVEHAEYEESAVHPLYRPLIAAGMGFGAQRWVATLQRQCQCLAILMSSTLPFPDQTVAILPGGRRSMLKLAQRMTDNFCGGVCASREHKWNKLCTGNVDEDVRVMTRKSVDDPGEPPGIVLSAATSVWLPVSPNRLFDFLRDERFRSQWDILSNGGPMQEMAHIAKGQDHGNCVSLLRATAMNPGQSSMLILQETCTDASGSLVVYAPVDVSAMHVVMNGGDSAYVALLPSGFAIFPDGPGSHEPPANSPASAAEVTYNGGPGTRALKVRGSLLTVAFQILVNSLPTAKLTVESVETVNNLISCTVQKIKAALPSDA